MVVGQEQRDQDKVCISSRRSGRILRFPQLLPDLPTQPCSYSVTDSELGPVFGEQVKWTRERQIVGKGTDASSASFLLILC
jgi:hypothetical protein